MTPPDNAEIVADFPRWPAIRQGSREDQGTRRVCHVTPCHLIFLEPRRRVIREGAGPKSDVKAGQQRLFDGAPGLRSEGSRVRVAPGLPLIIR